MTRVLFIKRQPLVARRAGTGAQGLRRAQSIRGEA